MKKLALYGLHDCAGHLGNDKTIGTIRERFYWFNLRDDTEVYIKQCLICQQTKHPQRKARAPLQNIKCGFPLERFGIDCVGPLPTTENGNKYITVVIDYFTKYPFSFASSDIKAETIADKLMDDIVCPFGVPANLHADQGSNFESNVFKNFCELIEIAKTRTTPFAPWSNGETERMNRTLIGMLKKMVSDNPKKWDTLLQKALMHYRSSVHSSTGFTPYRLMFGREMNLPVDVALNLPSNNSSSTVSEYVSKQAKIINETEELARQHLGSAQKRQKEFYDIKKSGRPYKKDDLVLLLVKAVPLGQSRKFYKQWSGPWKVVTVISDVDYRIQYIGTTSDKNRTGRRRKVRKIVHFNQLKLFYGSLEMIQEEEIRSTHNDYDIAEDIGLGTEQTNAENSSVNEDNDSDSVIGDNLSNQGSALRPFPPNESDSASAPRPGPERENGETTDVQDEPDMSTQRPLDPRLQEDTMGVDGSAQRPPEIVHTPIRSRQTERSRAQRPGPEETAGITLENDRSAQRSPELRQAENNQEQNEEVDRSAQRPPETIQTRPRRNIRLPARYSDFVMNDDGGGELE